MPADMNDYFKKKKPTNDSNNNSSQGSGGNFNVNNPLNGVGKGMSWLIIVGAVIFAIIAFKPFAIINSGEVGIKVRTGKFDEKPLNAGLHFFIPSH